MNQAHRDRWLEAEPLRLGPDDSPEAMSPGPGKWSELRAKTFYAASRERHERKVKSIVAVRRMLQLIDAERAERIEQVRPRSQDRCEPGDGTPLVHLANIESYAQDDCRSSSSRLTWRSRFGLTDRKNANGTPTLSDD